MARERYRALVNLTYPTAASLKEVLTAGGLSKLSPEQRDQVVLKRVKSGSLADGVPETSVKDLLRRGLIQRVGTAARKGKAKK